MAVADHPVDTVCGGGSFFFNAVALEHFGLEVVAQLAVVGAAISYAFAGIFGRRFQGTPPLVTAAGQLSASALMMLPLAMVVDRPFSLDAPTMETWGAVLGLTLLSTALAYVIGSR